MTETVQAPLIEPRRLRAEIPPAPDETERDAFEAAVEARVAEQIDARFAALEAKMREMALGAAVPAATADTAKTVENQIRPVLESLGMAFASLSAQGVGVTAPVAPEVIKAREEAHKLMVARIKQARIDDLVPLYRLTRPVYLDEAFVVERWTDTDHVQQWTEIEWPGVPNLCMMPLNDVAKEIHQAFKDSIGNMGRLTKSEELREFGRGLKVKGAARAERPAPAPSEFDANPYEGLKVRHKDGRGKTRLTHVLGTIAPPAEISG